MKGKLNLVTGLRIGAGDTEMRIGGVDITVVRHPYNDQPYIPGSSLKGKIRSLLEWYVGVVSDANGKPLGYEAWGKIAEGEKKNNALKLLQLFGMGGGEIGKNKEAEKIGPSRLSFSDVALDSDWAKNHTDNSERLVEIKSETAINRITGTAADRSLRQSERVPAGAEFNFVLSMKVLNGDDQAKMEELLLKGLKLLEMDALGGSGSRGYGRVKFENLTRDGNDIQKAFDAVDPFGKNKKAA